MNQFMYFSLIVSIWIGSALSHMRVWEPPSRATLWRCPEFQEYNFKPNYDDTQLFCGGYWAQHGENYGQCGACGDNYNDKTPRDHELGGTYGREGFITRTYISGQDIFVTFEITAWHAGYFIISVCPFDSIDFPASEEGFDRYQLPIVGTSGQTKYYPSGEGNHTINVQLPQGLTFEHGLLRAHYHCGNNWGQCEDGTGAVGCGPQETFRSCSDIRVI